MEVCRFANVLKSRGRQEGRPRRDLHADDPRSGRWRCWLARASAPRTRSCSAASAQALRDRINDAEAKVVITADGGFRRGRKRPAQAARRRRRWRSTRRCDTSSSNARRATSSGRRARRLVARARGRRRSMSSPSRWTARTRCSSSTPRARPASPKASCTRPAATWSARYLSTQYVFDLRDERRVLVHGRHRLGHRPQLHRLRPARQRRDGR